MQLIFSSFHSQLAVAKYTRVNEVVNFTF